MPGTATHKQRNLGSIPVGTIDGVRKGLQPEIIYAPVKIFLFEWALLYSHSRKLKGSEKSPFWIYICPVMVVGYKAQDQIENSLENFKVFIYHFGKFIALI